MIDRILSGWNFFRIVRLSIGAYFLIDGVVTGIWPMAAFGLFFTLMPLLNIGCCSTGGCQTNFKKETGQDEDDVIFEEIKIEKD